MKLPIIIINFKAYPQATGSKAVKLAKICQKAASQTKASIAVAVQASDIYQVAKAVKIPVLAQHMDGAEQGAHTGHMLAEAIKQAGAKGTLLNHSEKKIISLLKLRNAIERAKKLKLKTVVCAATPREAKLMARFKPDMIAIEPPELIGGKTSVSTARPEIIEQTTKAIMKIPVLCGAGVHNTIDVSKSRALGAKGVLVASGVVKAKSPAKILRDLVKGLK